MKNLLLGIIAILFSFNGWTYNETDLAKFRALNACESCDLSGAKFGNANLSGARFCKTKMPCVQSSTFRALAGPLNDPVLRWT